MREGGVKFLIFVRGFLSHFALCLCCAAPRSERVFDFIASLRSCSVLISEAVFLSSCLVLVSYGGQVPVFVGS
jgi:hypothetical protein